jgi:hypothetical protein
MIAETSAAISGIKVALDMARGIASLKNETEVNQAIIDIQRALLDAQSGALQDKQHISDLSDQISKLIKDAKSVEQWEAEKKRYRLTKSPKGAFTYDLQAEFANGEIDHRLCATCFEGGRKSILHTTAKGNGGEIVKCQLCQSELNLADFEYNYTSIGRRNLNFDGN